MSKVGSGFAGLVRFEGVLAVLLILVPIVLRVSEQRGSISVYHDLADSRWFFIPLTAAAMMLITNGLVRQDLHGHNAALGVLLLGVLLFDHDGKSATVHFASAVAFFVFALAFAVLMVTHYVAVSARKPPQRLIAVALTISVVVVLGAVALLLNPPIFWVEAVGVWMIAAHHLVHSSWEVSHPGDDAEPGNVLQSLWPRAHQIVAWLFSPFVRFWRRINRQRRGVIQGAATDLT